MLNRTLKQSLQLAISFIGPHRWHSSSPQLLVLMYHRILPPSDPRCETEQPGMIVEPDTFQMHLRTLSQYFEPIHLTEWIEKAQSGSKLPNKSIAITFDDGWADNYDYAFPIIKEEKFPASIFLCTDLIDTQRTYWPEQLMKIITQCATNKNNSLWSDVSFKWLAELDVKSKFNIKPSGNDLDALVSAVKKRFTEDELYFKLAAMRSKLGEDDSVLVDILTWTQIEEMFSSGLVQFGSHTRNHIRMNSSLSVAKMQDELLNSKHIIESKLQNECSVFCYPNGDMCSEAEKLVKQTYKSACSTQRGWNSMLHFDAYTIRRIAIHQDISKSKIALLARISGWI